MGYTQHWSLEHIKANAVSKKILQSALNDMAIVLETIYSIKPEIFIADLFEEESRNFEIIRDSQGNVSDIIFGDLVEPFTIDNQACGYKPDATNYIKTGRLDYDLVVVACLTILANAFDNDVVAKSDGSAEDWEMGVKLVSEILEKKVSNPKFDPQKEMDQCYEHFELCTEILAEYNKSSIMSEAKNLELNYKRISL